jgi:DNA-binding response OmpR family regulator
MTKIALIEDDSIIAQMYRMKFESDGFDIQVADNGHDGVALVEQFSPDIILMDMHIPGLDGVEALKLIRGEEWGKNIPVIFLTNLDEDEAPKDIRSLGIDGYIVKADLTPSKVVERVKTTLGLA